MRQGRGLNGRVGYPTFPAKYNPASRTRLYTTGQWDISPVRSYRHEIECGKAAGRLGAVHYQAAIENCNGVGLPVAASV